MSMNSAVDRNIFIADKDLAFRNALAHGFESEGYRVTSFSDGNALLAAARQKSPSCIVLDADISNPPGLDVLGELGHRIVAPITVTAGRADVETAVSAMKKGARDFMPYQMSIRNKAFSIINNVFKKHGAGNAFSPIVAFGKNTSLPHYNSLSDGAKENQSLALKSL